MRKYILLAAILVGLVGTQAASANDRPNPVITQAAQKFTPTVTSVRCDYGPFGYGYAYPETGKVVLNQYLCGPLKLLIGGFSGYTGRQGAGLITLVHESLHTTAFAFSEARTECVAFQAVDNVLRLWKTPFWLRPAVLDAAYQDHYNLIDSTPNYRNEAKCRPNGAWDNTPYDGRWP